ncbi:MAG: hypothetical protein IPG06_22220 [Haliea sp.]|nr:hypothetical protein [Haliea sp.]
MAGDDDSSPLAALKALRSRLHFLTPVEVLRGALDAGNVRESGCTAGAPPNSAASTASNNLAALLGHAADSRTSAPRRTNPPPAPGWCCGCTQRAAAEEDTQATGGAENAIQLVTHWGAKGLSGPS